MKPESPTAKLWLLRAWLYAVPIVLMTPLIISNFYARTEVDFCRYVGAPISTLILLAFLFFSRKLEKKEGLLALPDGEGFGKFCVFLALLCLIFVAYFQKPDSLIRAAGLISIVAGAPHLSMFKARRKPAVPE